MVSIGHLFVGTKMPSDDLIEAKAGGAERSAAARTVGRSRGLGPRQSLKRMTMTVQAMDGGDDYAPGPGRVYGTNGDDRIAATRGG